MDTDRALRKEKSSEEEEILVDSTRTNQMTKGAQKIYDQAISYLSEIRSENADDFDTLLTNINSLKNLVEKNPNNDEVFFYLIEGIAESALLFQEDWEKEKLCDLLESLLKYLEQYQEREEYLIALNDALVKSLETLMTLELYDDLEEYAIRLINKAIEIPNNLIIRTIASEATIISIRAFGDDWNYEKTKEYDIILKGLLPVKEIDNYLASILVKGLTAEINAYGDMHEFSSLKRTLLLMRQLYAEGKDFDSEFLIYYTDGLVSAINWLGEAEEYDEMMITLNELTNLVDNYPDPIELKIKIADGLRIALDHCGVMDDLDSATILAKQLLQLADNYPNYREIQSIAIMGVFKAAIWAGAFWEAGLVNNLLSYVSKIHNRFPEDHHMKLLLCRGLFNLTKELAHINKDKLFKKIIGQIADLYQKNPDTIEIIQYYSKAIVNMLYLLSEFTEDYESMIYYLSESEKLATIYSGNETVVISYSKSLVNAIRSYGLHGKISEMEELIDILIDYETTTDNFEITIRLGKAYIDAIKVYGDIGELDKVLQLYMVIKDWVEEDPYNIEFQIILGKALVNVISAFGKNKRLNEMVLYLDELRDITILYPSVNLIQEQLAKGLSHTIRWHVAIDDLNRSISMLHELRSICLNLPNDGHIQEMLARSTRRISVLSYKQNKFELVEELLESLRKQLTKLSNNENIQIELARALTNIILEESSQVKTDYWHSLIMELEGLTIQYPKNSKLMAIHQTVAPLIKE